MRAILFDFDGTLADTLPNCYHAFQEVFKNYDAKTLNDEEVKAMFGPSETDIMKENLNSKDLDDAIEYFYEQYMKHHAELVDHYQEIDDMLSFLKNAG